MTEPLTERLADVKDLHLTSDFEALKALEEDAHMFAALAATLREQSDELNVQLQGDIRPSEYQEIAKRKRRVDAEAFELEQAVRAIQSAHDQTNPESVSNTHFTWQ